MKQVDRKRKGNKSVQERYMDKVDEIVAFINKKFPELPKGFWPKEKKDE